MSFYVAMQNRTAYASYSHPYLPLSTESRFLIVSRTRGYNQHITIADAGLSHGSDECAPDNLSPIRVLIGTLAVKDDKNSVETFIFNRHKPEGVAFEGAFFPADGFAVLSHQNGYPKLHACGRHAHIEQYSEGQITVTDQTGPVENSIRAFSWHYDAIYLPWVQELLPEESLPKRDTPSSALMMAGT